jgi:hypothetical protein
MKVLRVPDQLVALALFVRPIEWKAELGTTGASCTRTHAGWPFVPM